jgi:VWFA-related protein
LSARGFGTIATATVLLLSSSTQAQQAAPRATAVFPVASQMVWIDAVAVDSEDQPVATLTQEDFEVVERGARQPIILFRPPDPEATGRAVVFLIEDAFARDWHVERARELIARAAAKAFAGDRILLVAKASQVATSARLPDASAELQAALGRVRAHSQLARAANDAAEIRRLNESRVDTLVAAIGALWGHSGPRAVVVLGPPCPYRADGPFGEAAYDRVMRASQQAAAPIYFLSWEDPTSALATPEPGLGPAPVGEALAGVSVAPTSGPGPGVLGTLLFDAIGRDSGGFSGRAPTTWSWSLDRVFQRSRAAYLLGIPAAPDRWDGRYHRLDVRVTKQGVRLYGRKGYYAPKPEPKTR